MHAEKNVARQPASVTKHQRFLRAKPLPNARQPSWRRASENKSLRTPDTAPPALRPLRRPVSLDKVERILI